ncbi:MAG: glucosaminidase domain-containing protein [Acidobacteriia bacterium]|nr:glucosaminidase domain-containing protein [Terriglobia bacterium]
MDTNLISEYLVGLGFDIKDAEVAKFKQALKDAEETVETAAAAIGSAVAVAGAAVAAVYASIATATVEVMNSVAQADLHFQMLARTMFISTDAARRMQIATDALGASLQDVIFGPPEMRERYLQLISTQQGMEGALGGDFETQMRLLRDLRFEFTRFMVEVKMMTMAVVAEVARAFGTDEQGLLGKLRAFNDWIQRHAPQIRDAIAEYIVPVLRDTWAVLRDLFDIGRMVADMALNLYGALFGPLGSQVDQKTSTLEKFAQAITEISHALRGLFDLIDRYKQLLGVAGGAWGGAKLGMMAGGLFGPEGVPIGGAIGALLGGLGGFTLTDQSRPLAGLPAGRTGTVDLDAVRQQAQRIAAQTGADANLILAHWMNETGGLHSRLFGQTLNLGMIKDPRTGDFMSYASLADAADAYGHVISQSRFAGVRSAKDPAAYSAGLYAGRYFPYDDYLKTRSGMSSWQGRMGSLSQSNSVVVNVSGASDPQMTAHAVKTVVEKVLQDHSRRNQLQFVGPAYAALP